MNLRRTSDRGFTIIELLVVLMIIGLLAAIAIPILTKQKERSADAAVESDLRTVATQLEGMNTANGRYPTVAGWESLKLTKVHFTKGYYAEAAVYRVTTDGKKVSVYLKDDISSRGWCWDSTSRNVHTSTAAACAAAGA